MTPPKLSTLSPEEKRIIVAEACGWTRTRLPEPLAGGGDTWGYWTSPIGDRKNEGFDPWNGQIELPNYPESLNAMYEAEKVLTEEQVCVAIKHLGGTFLAVYNATAAQRLDAFLLATGKATV